MQYSTLLFDVRDNIAHITLNRPEAANSINLELARELMYAVLRCDEEPDIRAVVISGAGSLFCAGGDLKTFASQGKHLPYHIKEVTTYLHAAISRLTRMDPPVLAAGAPKTLGAAKRLLHSGWTETLETQMEHESQTIAAMAHTSDTHEGIAAFLEKRSPMFKGK